MTYPTTEPNETTIPAPNDPPGSPAPQPTQPTPPAQPAPQQPTTDDRRFSADDIERVRREEKDKVYSRLDDVNARNKALADQVEALLAAQKEREAAEEEARRVAAEEAKATAEAEMDAKQLLSQREQEFKSSLAEARAEWEKKFEELNQQSAQERAMLEKEKEFAALSAYTQQRVADEADNIAPQLIDFITGNSPEEIDKAIEVAKAKSAEIAAAVQENLTNQRAQQRGVAPTGYAPVGPMDMADGQRQYTPEDIQNMSYEEYAEFRQKAGIGGQSSNRGLFS